MNTLIQRLNRKLQQSTRMLAISSSARRRVAALGALLLVGTTVTALATANTPPTLNPLQLSQSQINEGGSVTLSGTFSDPDPADIHVISIHWNDGPAGNAENSQKIVLNPGVFTFQATHTYKDDFDGLVYVIVQDHQLPIHSNDNSGDSSGASRAVKLVVKNVAPTMSDITVGGRARTYVIEGKISDPGSDTEQVFANWSGNILTRFQANCEINRRSFRCEHTYPVSATVPTQIRLTVKDDDGGQSPETVPLAQH